MVTVQQIRAALYTLFGREIELIARQSGWVTRTPLKLDALVWLQIWVLGFLEKPDASYGYLAKVARDLGVHIRRQGIQSRLNPAIVPFMQAMFERARATLQSQVTLSLALLQPFSAIQLLDSTTVALPQALEQSFPASGGDGPRAGLKLQVLWEFLRGNLDLVSVGAARRADQGFRAHRDHLTAGGLFLADLGYFVLASLQAIVDAHAFFISRYEPNAALYLGPAEPQRWDLLHELQALYLSGGGQLERVAWLGQHARLECRVLAVRLPDDVVQERRRRARETARRKGRAFSAQQAAWLAWNVYVTNVPAAWLSLTQVVLVYTLRWQIELLFRLWKQEGQLDRIAGHSEPRILCEVYAKLIGLLLFHYLTAPWRGGQRELSLPKALQTFRRQLPAFREALSHPQAPERLEQVLAQLIAQWREDDLKDQRRTRLSTCQEIERAACASVLAGASPEPIVHCA